MDVSEFKASLMYKACSRTARTTYRNLVSKNKKKQNTNPHIRTLNMEWIVTGPHYVFLFPMWSQ